MSMTAHIEELRKKHAHLSEEVETAQRACSVDALQIAELKKRKLRLKEEIVRLSQ